MSERLAQLSREERRRVLTRLQERRRGTIEASPFQAPIPRRQEEGPHPLSFAQQRLWFLAQLAPESAAYNVSRVLRLEGRLDLGAMSRSLREIVRRHDVLRTTFEARDGGPVQVVGPLPAAVLPVIDLAALPAPRRPAEARRVAIQEIRRPFDLARAPGLRTTLLRLGPAESLAVFTMHHIICDDRSIGLLVRELMVFYQAFLAGRPARLPELPIQFADFARWQRERLQGGILEEQLAHWRRQLAGAPRILELPVDHLPLVQTFRGGHRRMDLPGALAESLRAVGRERGATPFMTLLAALQTLLGRHAGTDDVVVGSPVTYRDREEVEPLIGFFVNALALRADLSGDPPFRELLDQVRETALAAYARQELPFERLVEELQPDRDLGRPPIFQVMLIVQSASRGGAGLALPGLKLSPVPLETGTARIDLGFDIIEGPQGIAGEVEFSVDLFEPATIERLIGHFTNLLYGIAADPGRRLSELPLLSPAERHQLLAEWTDADPACGGTVHERFAERARLRPGDPAVVFRDTVVSYGELDRLADALARRLRAAGVGPESPVALLAERSPEAVAGILGILKAGGCYVPLDPDYPSDRLELMLRDAGVAAVVTQERFAAAVAPLGRPVLAVDGAAGDAPESPLPAQAGPDHPVYVIYTSGTLGRPKGVVVPHGALANFSRAIADAVGLGPGERMLEFASLAFDASALQIFPTLISGAALVLEPNPGRLTPGEMIDLCERQGVTVLDLPAAVWRQWTEELAGLGERILPRVGSFLTGGESLSAEKLRSWARLPARPARLFSSYGPTEATVTTTLFATGSGDVEGFRQEKIPLGRPLPGARVHLLDRHGGPVPVGVPGEIFIAGAGLARGYLRRPELTAAAFVPAPPPVAAAPGERLYRTGDLARWLPEGELEFLGRADHQVKIRGFRVELGEIEALLARFPGLRDAVVTAPEESGGSRRLIAYVVTDPGQRPSPGDLRSFLARSLPDFMVPPAFVALDELPLLPSGKVDRRALPAPEPAWSEAAVEPVPPRDPVEQVLAEIFVQVLKVERIGVLHNFFELGGHSLLATQVISRVRQVFEVDLKLQALFEEPTIAGLAAALRRSPDRERVEKTAALRVQLAGMSDAEVEALLLAEVTESAQP